jgi:hypothetical protein
MPISMACHFTADDITNGYTLMSLADKDLTNVYYILQARADQSGDPVRAIINDASASPASADTSSGYAANTWYRGAAIFASSTSRSAYLDGGSKVTNITSRTPTGIDRFSIGRIGNTGTERYLNGKVAEAGMWDVALSDDDVASLARGFAPILIKLQNLVSYWRLIGHHSPEIDPVGRVQLSLNNTPTKADHPRVFGPRRR